MNYGSWRCHQPLPDHETKLRLVTSPSFVLCRDASFVIEVFISAQVSWTTFAWEVNFGWSQMIYFRPPHLCVKRSMRTFSAFYICCLFGCCWNCAMYLHYQHLGFDLFYLLLLSLVTLAVLPSILTALEAINASTGLLKALICDVKLSIFMQRSVKLKTVTQWVTQIWFKNMKLSSAYSR